MTAKNGNLRLGAIESGSAYPLGATYDGYGTNFAVFSANALKIELCVFDEAGRHEIARIALPECTGQIWHGYVPNLQAGTRYGYRAHGPYRPEQGHRFNPNKLLLDPYAKLLHGQIKWTDALYGYRVSSQRADLSYDRRDSAPAMVKGVVTDDCFNWHDRNRPRIPWSSTVFYEAHVRGMTMEAAHIRAHERGTFAGLCDPYVIDHLVKLGVTSLELLPVHAFVQDRRLVAAGLTNYWGYNTLSYFAPEPRYLATGSPNEMRRAIQQLHTAGIEVILDVVYNHTCEESELGPTLSFRGLDNASYYRLQANNPRYTVNDTGCGNTVNLSHPRVIQLVMDSLRHWVEHYHVDGFRFDLGATLGREPHGFDPGAGFFDAIAQDPVLAQVKLISEPWDIGPGGYQVGNHPPVFAEWNDRFRDDVRRFWRGDTGMRKQLAARLLGSPDFFKHHRRRPWASVNFVTAHDGFTLQDLVSYDHKHNEANGEDNRDGSNDNQSRNWGIEGPTDDPGVRLLRERIKRAMLMTLMFSNGTPLLLGGDEFGRTQRGNNNAYCQDNEISWFDWNLAESDAGRALTDFTRRCIEVRLARPTLRSARFFTAEASAIPGVPDVTWFDETGEEMTPEKWEFGEGRLLALRRVTQCDGKAPDGAAASLLLLNAFSEDREFVLPQPGMPWRVIVDAADPRIGVDAGAEDAARTPQDNRITVAAHSAVLLVADHVAL
ncbi:MAG: glycogen debranching protein GlgX [Burkholderiaceae bacterium]